MRNIFIFLLLLPILSSIHAQDSLLLSLIRANSQQFSYEDGQFEGAGWQHILQQVTESANVLIGEDHFSNEIPAFIKAIAQHTRFENFYIEVDPYSTHIIENTFKQLSEEDRKAFHTTYGHLYSFYALKPEYELLSYMMKSGVNLLGSDQIIMYADRLICQELIRETNNVEAKAIYDTIMEQSRIHLDRFLENPQQPMYFMTPGFGQQLDKLEALDLSEKENQIIADMRRSVSIYQERSHRKRVALILNQLMKDYPQWNQTKNLFKYGANHLCRGESFLTVFDIGNMVANITESNYDKSFHLMIVGESGMLGSPFSSFPPSPVDTEKGFYLSYLKPFFSTTEGDQWHLFDLRPLRKAIEKKELKLENLSLLRAIKGYDALVIIPEVTAATF